jgi:hypothetical protein
VPASQAFTCDDELHHIEQWAATKNLHLNRKKSVEIIFRTQGVPLNTLPPPIANIERFSELKLLGVTIRDDLKMSSHIVKTLAACEQSLYALRIMKAHGMQPHSCQNVFHSVTLAKLTYCSPAWWGYANAAERDRIEGFLRRCKRFGYYPHNAAPFAELCTEADTKLLKRVINDDEHVLHYLLPPCNAGLSLHNLRPRKHNRTLPAKSSRYDDSNFFTRMLMSNCCEQS